MLLKESERHLKGKVASEENEQNSEAEMPEFWLYGSVYTMTS